MCDGSASDAPPSDSSSLKLSMEDMSLDDCGSLVDTTSEWSNMERYQSYVWVGVDSAPPSSAGEAPQPTEYLVRHDVTAYEVLNVDSSATQYQIDQAYENVREYWSRQEELAHSVRQRVLQKVDECYEKLKHAERRHIYDQTIGVNMDEGDCRHGAAQGIGHSLLKDGIYGKLLRHISSVSSASLPFDLQLPKIVVIGNESHGKSALMERIAMRETFPRGEDFTTRMPIRMKMRHMSHENAVIVRLVRAGGRSEVVDGHETRFDANDAHQGGVFGESLSELIGRKIKNFIVSAHATDDGSQILTDQEIEIEILAANVPNLELVDLPGLVATPPDVAEASLELTHRFLKEPNTLVLCVVEDVGATVRGAQVLREIVKHEGLPSRTVVVLTKVDVPPQNPERLARRLSDTVKTVGFEPFAIIPVMNRAQDEVVSLSRQVTIEREKFLAWSTRQPQYAPALPAVDRLGIGSVLNQLVNLLEDHMGRFWVPRKLQDVEKESKIVQDQIDQLGTPVGELCVAAVTDRLCECLRDHLDSSDFESGDAFAWLTPVQTPLLEALSGFSDQHTGCRRHGIYLRMYAKELWRAWLEDVPIGDLISGVLDLAMADTQDPVKLNRLDLKDLLRVAKEKLIGVSTELRNMEFPEWRFNEISNRDMSASASQMSPASWTERVVQNAVIDTIYERLLIPMSNQSFWDSSLGQELREIASCHELRTSLNSKLKALENLADTLKEVKLPENANRRCVSSWNGPPETVPRGLAHAARVDRVRVPVRARRRRPGRSTA